MGKQLQFFILMVANSDWLKVGSLVLLSLPYSSTYATLYVVFSQETFVLKEREEKHFGNSLPCLLPEISTKV